MRQETQFSVFLINKPGVLATVTGSLAQAGVNILALSLSDSGEHGVLRILTDDVDRTREVLNAEHDRWTETDVVVTKLEDHPGAFASTANRLSEGGVNVLYAYCTGGFDTGVTYAVFKVADTDRAKEILGEE
jgi:hypothetical protein